MLRQLLRPNWLRECTLAELPLQELLDQPIRALVLDVDRTLLPRRQAELPASALRWLQQAKEGRWFTGSTNMSSWAVSDRFLPP